MNWLEMRVGYGIRPLPPVHMFIILPSLTVRMVIGPPPKIPFGFELDHTYILSQVSLTGPRTSSIAVTKTHNSGRCLFSLQVYYNVYS